jgi:hypothetical protein
MLHRQHDLAAKVVACAAERIVREERRHDGKGEQRRRADPRVPAEQHHEAGTEVQMAPASTSSRRGSRRPAQNARAFGQFTILSTPL